MDVVSAVGPGIGVIFGPGPMIDGGTKAWKLCIPAVDVVVMLNEVAEGVSVAEDPQAVNTILIASIGRVIIFDIRWPISRRANDLISLGRSSGLYVLSCSFGSFGLLIPGRQTRNS